MRDQSLFAHELLCLHLKAYYSLAPCSSSPSAAGKPSRCKKTGLTRRSIKPKTH
jgi:hypothetical protein